MCCVGFFFFNLQPRHMEVPRPGIESESQLQQHHSTTALYHSRNSGISVLKIFELRFPVPKPPASYKLRALGSQVLGTTPATSVSDNVLSS